MIYNTDVKIDGETLLKNSGCDRDSKGTIVAAEAHSRAKVITNPGTPEGAYKEYKPVTFDFSLKNRKMDIDPEY